MFILFRYLMNTWPIHQNWNFCTLKERHSAIKERKEPKFKHGVHFFPWIIRRCNKTFLKIIIVIRWPNHLIRYVHPLFYTKISLWRFFFFFPDCYRNSIVKAMLRQLTCIIFPKQLSRGTFASSQRIVTSTIALEWKCMEQKVTYD